MTEQGPPRIFDKPRRAVVRRRAIARQRREDAARFVLEDMADDVLERIGFVRLEPGRALVIGDLTQTLAATLGSRGWTAQVREPADGFDEEAPYPDAGYDLIASLGTLDTIDDLPGALIHIRQALRPGGMMIASFPGAGSLPALRAALLAADAERPSARIHPQIDARAGGQLLQRAGFADPVADLRDIDVAYRAFGTLIGDVRDQALSQVLADPGPPLGKAGLERARRAFAEAAEDGRTRERFTILTLSGRRPPER
ncbi:methyltransferase domain-containing protein [Novosphingobium aquimarinum]|uniref:methyltransferase domain-containing protein n=1 Tax=Novosphingobium aquimarinum TaxID=2682494 RepID=UPI0012EC5FB3|nr:methyltransferase domain-containing protein [Novosphingobium aquimarinum]